LIYNYFNWWSIFLKKRYIWQKQRHIIIALAD
jgi:hypothetical protein